MDNNSTNNKDNIKSGSYSENDIDDVLKIMHKKQQMKEQPHTDSTVIDMDVVKKHSKYCNVKSRNMTQNALDIILELRTESGGELVRNLIEIESVTSASLMSHDGEVTFT